MPRYYFGENASRPIRAGGQQFAFTITANPAGTLQGVVAVPDDQHDAFLAVASRYGVVEISQAAYEEALAKKKANPRWQVMPDLTPPGQPEKPSAVGVVADPRPAESPELRAESRKLVPMPPIKGNGVGAKVVDGASIVKPGSKELLPMSLDDAVDLGTAAPPVAEQPKAKESTKRQNHRQKRGMAAA